MPARHGFPVSIFVEDVAKNVEYLVHVLGFREVERFELPDGTLAHALVTFGSGRNATGLSLASIGAMTEGTDYDFGEFGQNLRRGALGNGVVLDFVVPDVDRYHKSIVKKGALIDEPPTDQFWGERTISVRLPDGYYLAFAKKIKGFKVPPAYGRFVRPKAAKRKARR